MGEQMELEFNMKMRDVFHQTVAADANISDSPMEEESWQAGPPRVPAHLAHTQSGGSEPDALVHLRIAVTYLYLARQHLGQAAAWFRAVMTRPDAR